MKNFLRVGVCLCIIAVLAACSGNNDDPAVKNGNTDSLPPDLMDVTARIQADPENDDLYRERAELYLQREDPGKALTDINKALHFGPDDPANFKVLSDVYFMMGKVQKCREALEKALETDPEYSEAYLKLAELEFYFKEYKKAFAYTDKALEIDQLNAKAHFIRGMCYKESGDTLRAVKSFREAVDIDQEYFHAFMQLGIIFSARHDPIAVDYFNNALNINPKSIEALYALGMFLQEHEEYNRAIEAYTSILQIDPSYKFAHYNLGYIHLVYLRVYDVAVQHFTNAIQADPAYAEAWYNRGYCYELMGDLVHARADYQKALQLRTNYAKAIEGMNRLDRLMK